MSIIIEAIVRFFSAEHGGRSNPPSSGYRPPVWFHEVDAAREPVMWDFEFDFTNQGPAAPVPFGEDVRAVMRAVSATSGDVSLQTGATFEVREGARVVGQGRVERVLSE